MAEPNDSFNPAPAHAELLKWARTQAEADAARHADDLLGRQLPFAAEAEKVGRRRLELLSGQRSARLSEARGDLANAVEETATAAGRLAAADAALLSAGVPAEELALEPLGKGLSLRPLAAALAVAVACAGAGAGLAIGVGAGGAALAAAGCLAVALLVVRPPSVEAGRLSALRRERAAAAAAVLDGERASRGAQLELDTIPELAASLARGEQALAGELLAAYMTALFGALPPGALADGADFGKQRDPEVKLPPWARVVAT